MIKILHTSDSHFKADRLDECNRNALYISDYVKDNIPDLIIHAGDLFDKNTVINSKEYISAVDFISNLSSASPVVIIRGNHDPEGSINLLNKLPNVYAYEEITAISSEIFFSKALHNFKILLLPYQKTLSTDGYTVGSAQISVSKKIENVIKNFISDVDGVKFLVGHFSVDGVLLANSEKLIGNEPFVDPSVFNGINGGFLGHIHRHEQKVLKSTPVAYAGPHYRTRFDEYMEPVFLEWEFDDNYDLKKIKSIKTPARKMMQFNLDIDQTKEYIRTNKIPYDIPIDGDIKIVFNIKEGMVNKINREKLRELNPNLKIETIVSPKTSVKSEKIVKLKTKNDIFNEWANVSNIKLTKSLNGKIDEIIQQY